MNPLRQEMTHFAVSTAGRGFHDLSRQIASWLAGTGLHKGLLTVFCRHTSASLLISENADPTVRDDLMAFLDRIAPEHPAYAHDTEGPDDMPAHLRAAITATQLAVPFEGGRLSLGTWQAIYLVEHRRRAHRRDIVLHAIGE